jgi:hypothetical protein
MPNAKTMFAPLSWLAQNNNQVGKLLGHKMAVEWCENFVPMVLIFVGENLFCNTYVVDVAPTL